MGMGAAGCRRHHYSSLRTVLVIFIFIFLFFYSSLHFPSSFFLLFFLFFSLLFFSFLFYSSFFSFLFYYSLLFSSFPLYAVLRCHFTYILLTLLYTALHFSYLLTSSIFIPNISSSSFSKVLWEVLNFAVLAAVCIICCPSDNSRRLSYASQLPTDDPGEETNTREWGSTA